MATCVLALVVGVGVGRAQEKPAKPEPVPVPPVVYFPPIPPSQPLTAELAAMEAAGCKVSFQAIPAAEAKCKTCTGCGACAQTKTDDCCSDCAKRKKDAFASGCGGACTPPKKAKKTKRIRDVEYFQLAVPPPFPPTPIPQPCAYVPVHGPAPMAGYPNNVPVAIPIPAPPVAEPIMVFRAVSKISATACGSNGCSSGVQQAKHEAHGKITLGIGLSLTGNGMPFVQAVSAGQLEIECGSQCKATCETMTLHLA